VSHPGFDGGSDARVSLAEGELPPHVTTEEVPQELLDRGARLVFESERPISQVAADLGVSAETLRRHVRRVEVDTGRREGLSTEERDEIRKLRKENFELRRANEILKAASVFFAKELDPDRPK
jgi:transposase